MIAVDPGYYLLLFRHTKAVKIVVRQPYSSIVRRRAAASKESVINAVGCERCELRCKMRRRRRGHVRKCIVIRQFCDLLSDDFGHLRSIVANVHAP